MIPRYVPEAHHFLFLSFEKIACVFLIFAFLFSSQIRFSRMSLWVHIYSILHFYTYTETPFTLSSLYLISELQKSSRGPDDSKDTENFVSCHLVFF